MDCFEKEVALKWCLAFKPFANRPPDCEFLLHDLVKSCGYNLKK